MPQVVYMAVTRARHQREAGLYVVLLQSADQCEDARLSVHIQDVRVCTCYTDISKLFVLQYTLLSGLLTPSSPGFKT